MRSFIFNFRDSRPNRTHIAALLALCAVFCVAVEVVTAHYFGRVSKVERRRESEFRAAWSLRSAKDQHETSVLVAGNSLLLEGMDFPELQQSLGPAAHLQRTVFENTFYLDW